MEKQKNQLEIKRKFAYGNRANSDSCIADTLVIVQLIASIQVLKVFRKGREHTKKTWKGTFWNFFLKFL